jgi:cytochrome b involved in lipid metabolism
MKRFVYSCFVAFWASVVSLWAYAVLAAGAPTAPEDEAGEPQITLEELSRHASPDDCWMAIDGVVYDFTDYIPEHPTPPIVMTPWCGKEASEAYHTKGYGRDHSPAADAMLAQYRVGTLAGSEDAGSGP